MNGNLAVDLNPRDIRNKGIEVLTRELGPVGMARFIRQYDSGTGNYTEEKDALLADITSEDFENFLREKTGQ